MILLDTDVLIQVTRKDPDAQSWFSSAFEEGPPIPGIVALEFVVGSRDRIELTRARKFIATLDIRWHAEDDQRLAYELVRRYKLSTGLSLNDCLIAAQALNLGATLFTFNLRHLAAIPGLDARAPYVR